MVDPAAQLLVMTLPKFPSGRGFGKEVTVGSAPAAEGVMVQFRILGGDPYSGAVGESLGWGVPSGPLGGRRGRGDEERRNTDINALLGRPVEALLAVRHTSGCWSVYLAEALGRVLHGGGEDPSA